MRIKQIKETSLYVHNLELIRHFYEGKLGLQVISYSDNRHVFFRAGKSVLLCFIPEATQKESTLPPHFGRGNQHIAFEVVHEEYTHWQENLKAKNVEIIHEQEWKNGLQSFYFKDPEENLIEIVPEGIWE
jgi:catechol 2,3-dioxygenase-like lactoylglutathione lyase family enzyme